MTGCFVHVSGDFLKRYMVTFAWQTFTAVMQYVIERAAFVVTCNALRQELA